MDLYSRYLALAKSHGYTSFTGLQEAAFRTDGISDPEKNLFIVGETSAGKTLIPLLLYEKALIESSEQEAQYPKLLFVVPYRALAAQKKNELDTFFKCYDLKIVQSTGEYRQNDADILSGDVDIAVMITEKAFNYQAHSESFMSKYDYIVLDEVGLINSKSRGTFYDFLFIWGRSLHISTGRPRIIALGTPFYNWNVYIRSFDLLEISAGSKRPVALNENTIILGNMDIREVEGSCGYLRTGKLVTWTWVRKKQSDYPELLMSCWERKESCPVLTPCRTDPALQCGKVGGPCTSPLIMLHRNMSPVRYTLLQICRYHLLCGHQILIFINNRSEVVDTSLFLYRELKKLPELAGLFPALPSAEECRRDILDSCSLEGDDVYGILEFDDNTQIRDEHYQALKSGIAFHSAALPNELRTYVEDRLLEKREMKIVCSTETLAFGVNSTVDVVVVASLSKQDGASRMITLNEYSNYAGRAGRLRPGEDPSHIEGTVYTLVKLQQRETWRQVLSQPPELLVSVFYSDMEEKLPFFLVNLIDKGTANGVTFQQLLDYSRLMPRDDRMGMDELKDYVKEAVAFLVGNGLLEKITNRASGRTRHSGGPSYLLTDIGIRMRGYLLGKSDFDAVRSTVSEYVSGIYSTPDIGSFLFRLLQTELAQGTLKSIFENSETKRSFEELCGDICRKENYGDTSPAWMKESNTEKLYILGAILAWCEGASAKYIYKNFGIHYALLNRLSEQVSYLVKIAINLIPNALYQRAEELSRRMERLGSNRMLTGFDRESIEARCERLMERTERLSVSLYYGINTAVHQKLMDYLEGKGAEAEPLMAHFALYAFDPASAKEFRRIVHAYSFFDRPRPSPDISYDEKHNYLSLRRQHYLNIQRMDRPLLMRFFENQFGDAFTDMFG